MMNLDNLNKYYGIMPIGFAIVKIILDGKRNISDIECVFLNNAMANALQINKERVTNSTIKDIIPSFQNDKLFPLYQAAFKNKTGTAEYFSPRLKKYMSVIVYPYVPGYCACIMKETTEKHVAIQALQAALKSYSLVVFLHIREDYFTLEYPKKDSKIYIYSKFVQECMERDDFLPEEKERIKAFLDLSTLADRLKLKGYVKDKFRLKNLNNTSRIWYLIQFNTGDTNSKGEPLNATLTFTKISN